MPSDRPPSVTSKPGSDPAAPRRQTGVVRDGTIVFALVLVAFVAYALGAPATYRSTAVVVVQPVPGGPPVELPKPGEATHRMRQAALDPQVVMTLVSEEPRAPNDTVAEVRSRITDSLSLESNDSKTFTFAATASSAERSQRVCNAFAQQAANRAAQVLDPRPEQATDPGEKAKAELLAFLASHPGIASEPVPAPVKSGTDPLVQALRAERTRIEAELAQSKPDPDVENPYDDPPKVHNAASLRLRLKEIDKVLDARAMAAARASAAPAASSKTTSEVRAEWQRLLKAVSDSRNTEPPAPPGPRLKVTLARAALPRLPVEPDRARLVLVGVLCSIIAGLLAAFLRGRLEARAFRAYGMSTGEHAALQPQNTLRMKQSQLPKLLGPAPDPPPTPLPAAPVQAMRNEPIPLAPRIPTAIGHPALSPNLITPIPAVPTIPLTPVPAAAAALAPATPIPPKETPDTPIPPVPGNASNGDGPTTAPIERPPNTEPYGDRPRSPSGERPARRVTKIYGTPPPPDLKEASKGLLTTQMYGSPPVAIPPNRSSNKPDERSSAEDSPPPGERTSLKPTPMIPVSRASSSAPPPPNAPGTRSHAPLIETSYSYVSTPLPPPDPAASDGYPIAPASTQPYGRRRATPAEPGVIVAPAIEPARTPTPLLPPAGAKPADLVVTPHPVRVEWKPDASLTPITHKRLFPELVSLGVEACFVVAVSGATGNAGEQARIACEIALGLAELGTPRVLLIEGNFHFPHVHKLMNISVPITAGFSQQLQSRIQDAAARHWHVTQCSPTLHVLAEGVMRSPGLLLSRQFEDALRALRGAYDILVISGPAALSEPEGRALSDVVDGAVIVESKTRLDAAPEVTRYFSRHRFVRVLGV